VKKELSMTFDKATKGSVRYAETVPKEEQIIRTIYVRKSAFSDIKNAPQAIKVMVEW